MTSMDEFDLQQMPESWPRRVREPEPKVAWQPTGPARRWARAVILVAALILMVLG